jgi:hypothetical protein
MYSFSPQIKVQIGEVEEVTEKMIRVNRLERQDADEDDPYNGQGRELVIDVSSLDAGAGRYRLL